MSFVRFFAVRWWAAIGVALVLAVAGLQGAGAQSASAATSAPGRPAAASVAGATAPQVKAPAAVTAEDARPATAAGAAAGALAAARGSGRPAEVVADRTEYSQTFANPDGTMTYDASWAPLWVRQGDSWARPDASLVKEPNGSWSPEAATAGLTLSGGGGTTLATVTSGGQSLSVSWPSPLPAPTVSGATATYPGVFPGVDLAVTATTAGGFDETLVIEDQAAAADPQLADLQLGVAASAGLTRAAAADGSAQWQTAGGQPAFASSAPLAWNSAPAAAGAAAAGLAGPGAGSQVAAAPAAYSGSAVRLGVPAALLSGPAASFPVYVDPSYSVTSTVMAHGEGQSDSPNSFWWNTANMGAGDTSAAGIERSYYRMSIPGQLDGATVSSATFTDEAVATQTTASTAHTIDQYWTSSISASTTWDNQPSRNGSPVAASFTTASKTPNQNVNWNVAAWIQDTINSGADNWTTGLVNTNESATADWVGFSLSPTISITYTAPVPLGTGPAPSATFLTFPISDKSSLRVNVGSGDALFTTSDLSLPEIAGPLTLGLDYNSLLVGTGVGTGSGGVGWRLQQGGDVRLYPNLGTSGSVTFAGPDGTAGTFAEPAYGAPTYDSPPEFHATLTATVTSPCSGSAYQMTWHDTGEVMCFNTAGLLTGQYDRDGNATAFTYNGSSEQTQVAYTPAGASSPTETATASYTGSYLSGLSESGGAAGTKTITYGVDASGDLTSVKQADGATFTLSYDASHDLTTIEDGNSSYTYLTYDSARQVTSVTQTYNAGEQVAVTRLSYVSPTETQVATPTTNQSAAVSAVPNTTYTLNSEDLVIKAVDPSGDTRTDSYTPFNDVLTSTSGLAGGTTTNTYGANNGESLTASQSPTGAAASVAYEGASSTNPTAQYQPSSSTDAQGNVTAYTYDGAGNQQTSSSALPAEAQVSYNADGTPHTSTDPDGGVTSYGYNALHQLTSITPPTSGSLKAIHYTYDGFGRIATVTDGNGNTITYTYDLADRVSQVAYTGGAKTLTVTYYYDGAGNLDTMVDPTGTTTWTFDGRNMVLTKNAQAGGGTLAYTYDADGNMLTAADGAGTATYAYNPLDQLTSMTDPAGVQWQFAYNPAGERTTTYYNAASPSPSSYGVEEKTGYDDAGRISSIDDTGNTGATTLSDSTYCYSPYVSGQNCPAASASTDTGLLQWSENQQTGVVTTYKYDAGNRLKTATPTSGTSYSYGYDGDGDLTTGATAGSLAYNTSNQISSGGYGYDSDGSLTADPANGTLAYNDASQLTSASAASGGGGGSAAEAIAYAGAGQDQPLSDGSATAITYGMADQYGQPRVDSYTSAGTTVYILRDQQGDPLGLIAGGKSYIYLTDNSGSITGISGACGCSDASYAYTPYGSLISKSAGSGGALVTENLLGYTGALTDAFAAGSTGYVHDGARWYNPKTGAWAGQDASSYLANPANGNRYAYAGDDPANSIDPTGACSFFGCISDVLDSAITSADNVLFGTDVCETNVNLISTMVGVGALGAPATGGASLLIVVVSAGATWEAARFLC